MRGYNGNQLWPPVPRARADLGSCGCLNEIVLHSLKCLNTCSAVGGTVWVGLSLSGESVSLVAGLEVPSPCAIFSLFSLLPACNLRYKHSAVPAALAHTDANGLPTLCNHEPQEVLSSL